MLDARERKFLLEYQRLCVEHRCKIDACGCCESPWVSPTKGPKDVREHIQHLSKDRF